MAIFKVTLIIKVEDDIFDEHFTRENFVEFHDTEELKDLYENLLNVSPGDVKGLQAELIDDANSTSS